MITLKQITNNSKGDARYVCHFVHFLTLKEKSETDTLVGRWSYNTAIARAADIGGKKYNTKLYCGGIVFKSATGPEALTTKIEQYILTIKD